MILWRSRYGQTLKYRVPEGLYSGAYLNVEQGGKTLNAETFLRTNNLPITEKKGIRLSTIDAYNMNIVN